MKKEVSNINLSFQCHENWNEMKGEGNGRHCSSCNHKVHDFRNATEEEYLQAIKGSNHQVCGLFKASQVNNNYLIYAAATTMLAAAIVPAACTPKYIEPTKQIEESDHVELLGVLVLPIDSLTALYTYGDNLALKKNLAPRVESDTTVDETKTNTDTLVNDNIIDSVAKSSE